MNETLPLDDATMRRASELRRTLGDARATGSSTATPILALLCDGAPHGELSHCVVVRDGSATVGGDDQGSDGWKEKFVYRGERPSTSWAPA